MNNYKEPQKNNNYSNELDFGIILEKSFNNYKKIVGIAGVSILILVIIYFALVFGLIAAAFGFVGFNEAMTTFKITDYSITIIIGYLLFMAIFSGISANFTAGIYQMAYAANSNKQYEVGTLFYYFKTKYFKELFLSGVIIAVITGCLTLLFQYLNTELIGVIVTYTITFFTMLTIPIIIFSNLKAIDAITLSLKLIANNFLIILGLVIVAFILSMLGLVGLCIGIFFTLPLIYSTIFCIYNEILPIRETNIIDEIGTTEE
ncbi:hypothetical protein [Flavobacterium sp.]|uniref:hypothetical protein n=1 Tax=Flavobacterium sp. TaxID=239 RepID=UPI002B4B8652|nr:hypothetical protein [Flavobacterium sp.]HLP64645.1 hypothetical protein [Flavobacterium sp.]